MKHYTYTLSLVLHGRDDHKKSIEGLSRFESNFYITMAFLMDELLLLAFIENINWLGSKEDVDVDDLFLRIYDDVPPISIHGSRLQYCQYRKQSISGH